MRSVWLWIFATLLLTMAACGGGDDRKLTPLSSRTTTALRMLDNELSRRETYRRVRHSAIDSLTTAITEYGQTPLRRLEQTWELANLYDGFMTDSAIAIYQRGENLAKAFDNPAWQTRFKVQRLRIMPLTTIVHPAVNEFSTISTDTIPADLKFEVFDAGRLMYEYISSYYDSDPSQRAYWSDMAVNMLEKGMEVADPENHNAMLARSEYYFVMGQYDRSVLLLDSLLMHVPHDTNIAARTFHMMSRNAAAMSNVDDRIYWLAQSAIADVKSATYEISALTEIGTALYHIGDVSRAYRYLTVSLANAVECHAVLRMLETSRVLPMINQAHLNAQSNYQHTYLWGLGILGTALTVFMILLARHRHELKRIKVLKVRIERANTAKELYLSQFMSLATGYMNKLDEFCKIAERKIANGKVDEFYNLARSGRLVEDQTRDFYETFDNAFIHLYPSFVEDVNKLFRPDAQIEYTPGEPLSTDLRILAFMRIGVDDSTLIAHALHYSVNTIYTYRNKLKKRAIDRDNFERQIMNIGRGEDSYTKF